MSDLPRLWTLIKGDLSRAKDLLPDLSRDPQALGHYYEFVEHSELELAFRLLEEVAKGQAVGSQFWLALRGAATKMQLQDHATRYETYAEKVLKDSRGF